MQCMQLLRPHTFMDRVFLKKNVFHVDKMQWALTRLEAKKTETQGKGTINKHTHVCTLTDTYAHKPNKQHIISCIEKAHQKRRSKNRYFSFLSLFDFVFYIHTTHRDIDSFILFFSWLNISLFVAIQTLLFPFAFFLLLLFGSCSITVRIRISCYCYCCCFCPFFRTLKRMEFQAHTLTDSHTLEQLRSLPCSKEIL